MCAAARATAATIATDQLNASESLILGDRFVHVLRDRQDG